MAQKTKAQLQIYNDNNITTNGVNSITGAMMNEILNDMIASMVNRLDDTSLFGLSKYDNYRQGGYAAGEATVYNDKVYFANKQTAGNFTAADWDIMKIANAQIEDNAVSNDKLGIMPSNTLKGNDTGSSVSPKDLSVSEIINMLGLPNILDYKGSKNTYSALPTSGNNTGDTWNVVDGEGTIPDGANVAWNGMAWDNLGGITDLSGYLEKSTVNDVYYGTDGSGNQKTYNISSLVKKFSQLSDVPSYSGNGKKLIAVNAAESGLEVADKIKYVSSSENAVKDLGTAMIDFDWTDADTYMIDTSQNSATLNFPTNIQVGRKTLILKGGSTTLDFTFHSSFRDDGNENYPKTGLSSNPVAIIEMISDGTDVYYHTLFITD